MTISNANESDDDEDTQPTRPGIRTDIQPPPRKTIPSSKTTSGVGALVTESIRPSTTTGGTTISAIVRKPIVKATPTTDNFNSDR